MRLPPAVHEYVSSLGISSLRPAQEKAVAAGLLEGENVLVCSPTASGKTLIAEMAFVQCVSEQKMGVYVVPLKALASEKLRQFSSRNAFSVGMAVGDLDEKDKNLGRHDVLVVTAEKLDSLLRHHAPWVSRIGVVVVDEIHLLNDPSRGPTLEILLTMLRRLVRPQVVGLSATIGNPEELSEWLDASLVADDWRPVRLDKGVMTDLRVEFPDKPF